jgi:hypothetical protein
VLGAVYSPLGSVRGLFWFAFLFLALIWVFPASSKVLERLVSSCSGLFWCMQVETGFPVNWAILRIARSRF